MELQSNIYWLDGGASNLYLCVAEDGLTLIDTGMPGRHKLVFEKITALGYALADLKRILITHADIDHAGSAAVIQRETGATVLAGPETAELLRQGKSPKHMPRLAQFILDRFFKYKPVPTTAIQIIHDGAELPVLNQLRALATPGHTLDHFSFYSPATGVLFAGDALNTRNGRLNCTPKRITADQAAATRSAIRLLDLAPALIACGHGRPMNNHSSDDLMQLYKTLREN